MSKRLLDFDKETRTATYHEYDHSSGKTFIETVQDVKPWIEYNKRLQLNPEYQSRGRKQDFVHIARIPNSVLMKIQKEHGIDVFNKDDLPRLERLLQSSEYKYLRTVDKI